MRCGEKCRVQQNSLSLSLLYNEFNTEQGLVSFQHFNSQSILLIHSAGSQDIRGTFLILLQLISSAEQCECEVHKHFNNSPDCVVTPTNA